MANSSQFSTNLGLPILPDLTEADPRLYNEFVKLYTAIKTLAINLDKYTGVEFRDNLQQAEYSVNRTGNTYLMGNQTKIYKVFTEAASYGQLVSFHNGGARLAKMHTFGMRPAHGFCSTSGGVAIGEVGEITLNGIVTTSGLTGGTRYAAFSAGTLTPWEGLPIIANGYYQMVGYALSTTELLICPDINIFQYIDDGINPVQFRLSQQAIF